jgi:hypothetical protein
MAEPKTANFAGSVLKFGAAPFRAGRELDGAINELVDLMNEKGDQPRGDDPATAQNKAAIQIEQMKDSREKEKIKADAALKAAELQQKDQHKKWELEAQLSIEAEKLKAQGQEDAARSQEINLKQMGEREKQQTARVASFAKQQESAQKIDAAQRMQSLKERDMQAKTDIARQQAMFKLAQPPRQPGGFPR